MRKVKGEQEEAAGGATGMGDAYLPDGLGWSESSMWEGEEEDEEGNRRDLG